MVSLPDLDWYFLGSLLFYSSMSRYNSLCCCIFLCYRLVIPSSVFCFLLCMYYFVFDRIYFTLTLPPGVNSIAVNKYLSIRVNS